jgi:pimeloyl-ACP methyl ester carboxylesterase
LPLPLLLPGGGNQQGFCLPMTQPVLHFAHANGIVSACYRKFLGELEKDFEVKVLPAFGLDPRFPVNNNWASLTEQLLESVRTQSTAPVIGLGHSMGAMITYMAAYQHPELFRALVLMDPPVFNGAAAPLMGMAKIFGLADRVTPAGKSMGRRDIWPSRTAAYESLRHKALFRNFDEDCFNDYLRYGLTDDALGVHLTMPVKVEVEVFRKTPTNSWAFRRKQLGVPAAVIGGEKSEIDAAGVLDRLARKHRMLRLRQPGGHMFPLERPLETAAYVKSVIAQLLEPAP